MTLNTFPFSSLIFRTTSANKLLINLNVKLGTLGFYFRIIMN